ncbi:MAG: hypothetical protein SFT92_01160 [Rickettsiales bacterium]|nr:hypothetical protein [Rickettsiales bacterium]
MQSLPTTLTAIPIAGSLADPEGLAKALADARPKDLAADNDMVIPFAPVHDVVRISPEAQFFQALKPFLQALDQAETTEEFRLAAQALQQFLEDNNISGRIYTRLNSAIDFALETLDAMDETDGFESFEFDVSMLSVNAASANYNVSQVSFSIDFEIHTTHSDFSYETGISESDGSGVVKDMYHTDFEQKDYERITLDTSLLVFQLGVDVGVKAFKSLASKLFGINAVDLLNFALDNNISQFDLSQSQIYKKTTIRNNVIDLLQPQTESIVIKQALTLSSKQLRLLLDIKA